jgi:polyhydroxybutyrate depolymerase
MSTSAISRQLRSFQLNFAGTSRKVDYFVPSKLQMPSPLVLMLHGAGGNSLMAAKQTNWCEKAEREKFVVVFPNGVSFDPARPSGFLRNPQVWNSGVERGSPRINYADDVGFFNLLIESMCEKIDIEIDAAKVFAADFSNGGGMCWRLGIELSEKLAGVAVVCSYLSLPEPWVQTRPVPAVIIACLDDPLVPIDGGPVRDIWSRAEIVRPSVRNSVERYAALVGCSPSPDERRINEYVVLQSYKSAQNQGKQLHVDFYSVADAGHAYPGSPRLLSERIAGKRTDALQSTDVIWEFFSTACRA